MKMESEHALAKGSVPAFLMKLWKLVDNPDYDSVISWNQDGTAFRVYDQGAFSQQLLPLFYKHNNFSSFVRQVNMYGFRKLVDFDPGIAKQDKSDWEFFHPHFQRNKPHLLSLIKRKPAKEERKSKPADVASILAELNQLKEQNDLVQEKLDTVESENRLLWTQVGDLRDKHMMQQSVINKLINFLIQVVLSNDANARKRRAISSAPVDSKSSRQNSSQIQPYVSPASQLESLFNAEEYEVSSPSGSDDALVEDMKPLPVSPGPSITVLADGDHAASHRFVPANPDTSLATCDVGTCFEYALSDEDSILCVEPVSPAAPFNPDTSLPAANQISVITPIRMPCMQAALDPTAAIADTSLATSDISTCFQHAMDADVEETLDSVLMVEENRGPVEGAQPNKLLRTGDVMPQVLAPRAKRPISGRSDLMYDVEQISSNLDMLQEALKNRQLNIDPSMLSNLFTDIKSQMDLEEFTKAPNMDTFSLPPELSFRPSASLARNPVPSSKTGKELVMYEKFASPAQLFGAQAGLMNSSNMDADPAQVDEYDFMTQLRRLPKDLDGGSLAPVASNPGVSTLSTPIVDLQDPFRPVVAVPGDGQLIELDDDPPPTDMVFDPDD